MNIAQNLDRIEAAVNSLKKTIKTKDAGDPNNIDDVVEMIDNLESPIVSDPQFVFYDGSDASTSESLSFGFPLEIRMQFTNIKNGILAQEIDGNCPYYDQYGNYHEVVYSNSIEVVNNHMTFKYYDVNDIEHVITDPDPLDYYTHTWIFSADKTLNVWTSTYHNPFIAKDGVIVAESNDEEIALGRGGCTFFRAIKEGVSDNLYSGKVKVYHITPGAYIGFDSSENVRLDKELADYVADTVGYHGTYYPKHKDTENVAKLMSEYNYVGWTDSSVEAAILTTTVGRGDAVSAQYNKFDFPYLLTDKTVDASISTITYDASSDGFYGYSQVTVNAVDASIDSNIRSEFIKSGVTILGVTGIYEGSGGGSAVFQSKIIDIDIDTEDSSVEADSGYDGLSSVTIDASTLNMQRSNILEHLLGIAGTFVTNAIVSESELDDILNRLLGIAGTSVVNAVIDDREAQTILNELDEI